MINRSVILGKSLDYFIKVIIAYLICSRNKQLGATYW